MLFVPDMSILSFLINFTFPHALVSYCCSFVPLSFCMLRLCIWHLLSSFLVPVVSHSQWIIDGSPRSKDFKSCSLRLHLLADATSSARILVSDGNSLYAALLDWKRLRKKCKGWLLLVHQAKDETPVFSVQYVPKHRSFVHSLLSRARMRMAIFGFEEFQYFVLNCSKSENPF